MPSIMKKVKKEIPARAQAYISAGFNNTIITITNPDGGAICWGSAGTAGFKGTRKSTPFAASRAAAQVAEKALKLGVKEVAVLVKGPGSGRDAAIKSLKNAGLNVRSITDITPIPHNGCRPRKRRRV
jgi:small subunit ribosomal protein S11